VNIKRFIDPDGVAVLTFDRSGSSPNIFDPATLDELDGHLDALESQRELKGVVVISAKPKIFIAGADLNALASATTLAAADANDPEEKISQIVDLGHRVFTRLSRLPVPSVAAIHGACLGGGFELALACDWRVASLHPSTKLSLPETQLGILPAWGGCVRLPALIGLPAALGLILTGKSLAGVPAQKRGLVDEVTHPEGLLPAARRLISRGKRPRGSPTWFNRPLIRNAVAAKARRNVLAKTRGHYPAPLEAIHVCTSALGRPLEAGFALEKTGLLKLVRTPECRNLINLFFLRERAKKQEIAGCKGTSAPVQRVAVIGAGVMGAGIAQWISARGWPVRLKDIDPPALARGLHAIEKLYRDAAKRHVFTRTEARAGLDRITPVHTDVPLLDVDLVIEAAIEQLEVKQSLFRDLESRTRPDAVLASNTSALSIDTIAGDLVYPERVAGIHFFNPVHRMELVEIVRGPRTSSAALATALHFAKAIGKLPVVVQDSPGFLVNRLLLPYLIESVRLFREGHGVGEVDGLMLEFGMPMGPLRLLDEVGLDVAQHVAKDLERRLSHLGPIGNTLDQMIARGWRGKKSGCGFYRHTTSSEHAPPNPELGFLQTTTAAPRSAAAEEMVDRLVLVTINEAARCLAERVTGAADDVDFAMIFGTGWAPFRGGPLHYADTIGIREVVRRLEVLARSVAPHFEPSAPLRERAIQEEPFYSIQSNPEKTTKNPQPTALARR
jgi:3-hydroxyacyl-CoA dehydrogenase / enoyl-CoA hydratase / 3-hydroxybutyryl-CoA epimerase